MVSLSAHALHLILLMLFSPLLCRLWQRNPLRKELQVKKALVNLDPRGNTCARSNNIMLSSDENEHAIEATFEADLLLALSEAETADEKTSA